MGVDVSLLVVLLVCWAVHWTRGQDPLTVSITVDRTDPPGFTPENPTDYRAASGPQNVTCIATGGSGSGDYQYVWTSTCSSCSFRRTSTGATSVISRTAVHSGDIGTHTCTASRGGDSASASIVFNVVGAGIHIFNGATTGSQPNNGLAVFANPGSGRRIRFICRSDSLVFNVGELIGPDGNAFTGNDYLVLVPPPRGGQLQIRNTVGSEQPLPASEQGIYTCRIPLQSGEMVMINIGVYPIGFNSGPTVNDALLFTLGSPSTITCISTDSPATTVTFVRSSTTVGPLRDGESVSVGGVTYELAQRVINRRESTYENILTINDDLANLVDDTFTCEVANALGMDTSQPITITIITSISPQTVTVGDTVTFTCTSALGPAMIQWEDRDNGDMVLEMTSGLQMELSFELGPVTESMDGSMYRCRVAIDGSTMFRTVTLTIEANPGSGAGCSSDSVGIVGGVLGALVALLLAYGVVTTVVIVMMHRTRQGKVSIDQPVHTGVEQPVTWSAMMKLGDPDIKTTQCVAYSQAQRPSTSRAEDATYEVIGQ